MKIAVGSVNKTKIAAVEKALIKISAAFDVDAGHDMVFHPIPTETSVPAMPLTQNDIMKGARERALFAYNRLINEGKNIDFAIGLEGGIYQVPENGITENPAFLQNWVYVFDGKSGNFGSSSSLALPEKICHALYHDGKELAEVIDEISGLQDVRSNQGAFGLLTQNLITRSESFEIAVITAMIPFLNKSFYPGFQRISRTDR